MSRRSTPPPHQSGNLEEDDDLEERGGRRESKASVIFRVPPDIKYVLQTILQVSFFHTYMWISVWEVG